MTSSAPAAPPAELRGVQRPSVFAAPPCEASAGDEAIELVRFAGLELDPWQEYCLRQALLERDNGLWAAFEVGVCVSRQNGKGGIIEGRELSGLFLFEERLITHTAHQFDTAFEAFIRLRELIEGTPDFSKRVKKVKLSHGEEGIELYPGSAKPGETGASRRTGQRIRFRTRTKGGGRGFSGDLVMNDEAMEFSDKAHAALLPTVAARPNPQIWYVGSAVDQDTHENGEVFARVRKRGLAGDDPSLAYLEWSGPGDDPDEVEPEVASDPQVWARSNPALGIRITTEYVQKEQRALKSRAFAVERLNIGDWPATDEDDADQVIDKERVKATTDPTSKALDPVVFAFDVSPDRGRGAIAAAGYREDGLKHFETVEHKKGTGWIPDRLVELREKHGTEAIICDGRSPASALLVTLENLGLDSSPKPNEEAITVTGSKEYAEACAQIFDLFEEESVRHLGTPEILAAIAAAVKRPLSDSWAWTRSKSRGDITPLVAGTLALWGLAALPPSTSIYEERGLTTT